MRIEKLRTNHLTNPLGYQFDKPVFSWVVAESTGKTQKSARVRVAADEAMTDILFDTAQSEALSSLAVPVDLNLQPRTRYYWQVSVTAEDGDSGISDVAWFETGKRDEPWAAQWIAAPFAEHPVLKKALPVEKGIASARLYICGLGLYEAYFNGEKIGEEYLAPGYDSYQWQIQYQTFNVTRLFRRGENTLSVLLGKGWYCGRYGFGDKIDCIYGDRMQLLAELRIRYADGSEEVIGTDESWLAAPSPIVDSNIYDGEIYDARKENAEHFVSVVLAEAPRGKLVDRIGLPVKVMKSWTEYALLHTPAGELVLDFRQNFAGWVSFTNALPAGREVKLQFGELLQNENFDRDNLRTAEAAFTYISKGEVRPHFTYYGFRYVKVEGMTEAEIRAAHVTARAVWSELDAAGTLTTSNEKVNRLIQNALWSQRGNFVDIPTDCPQRDERMGWTGDAQAFSATACYNMYTPVFYRKYLSDMLLEQRAIGGSVPFVIPDALTLRNALQRSAGMEETASGDGSCAWSDAATVIPWNVYAFYGDPALLAEQYENMKLWVDYIHRQDMENCGGRHLWSSGFHFADWLALDNPDENSPFGGTDTTYVATCYYFLSATLTAKAAEALGKDGDAACYRAMAEDVKRAFQKEYLTPEGALTVRTQTAHVLALHLGLAPERFRAGLAADLKNLLARKGNHLDTGFVGTYQLCPTLSENGLTSLAYTLLFNEDYSSWLYEVNLGATTIWERWNSVLPDGSVSGTGMNSMNHYCYGSIVQWMYETVTGLRPAAPGFKRARIAPEPDERLDWAECAYDSAAGRYAVRWERRDGRTEYTVTVPFDAEAEFVFPDGDIKTLGAGTHTLSAQTSGKNNHLS